MKKILFPTDFSEAANRAFIYALNIARKWDAQIMTLHVYSPVDVMDVYAPLGMPDVQESLRKSQFKHYLEAVESLKKMAEEHGFGEVKIKHIMEEGPTVQTIVEVAEKESMDIIVMGTTGAHGLKEIFLSSIAAEVLENAPCMVLAVPHHAVFDGVIDNLAFTSSYREEEKKALMEFVKFAQPFEADIHTVNIDLSHTEFYLHRMDELQTEFSDHDHMTFSVVEGTDFYKSLTKFLEEKEVDILAMVTHKRNFIQELFHYSKAKLMSYHSKTPVLSIPAKILK